MKEGLVILKISKQEKDYLLSQGVKFGESGISHTTARHRRTYWLTESKKNIKLLNDYKDSQIMQF